MGSHPGAPGRGQGSLGTTSPCWGAHRLLPWAHSVGAESYLVPGATGMQRGVSVGLALERQEGGYVGDRGLLC